MNGNSLLTQTWRADAFAAAATSFFAGSATVRFDVTLRNPRRAEHPGGLWDLGDPGSVYVRDAALTLATHLGEHGELVVDADNLDIRKLAQRRYVNHFGGSPDARDRHSKLLHAAILRIASAEPTMARPQFLASVLK